MKILYLFANYNNMMYQWQKYHIFDELAIYGCQFDIISPLDYANIDLLNDVIVKKSKQQKYDLFLTSYNESVIYISTLDQLKKRGIPTLLFCPDNLVDPFRHKKVAKFFDLVWLTSKETMYLFKKWGATIIFLPYAANPFFLQPNNCLKEFPRICFIGTPHGSRVANIQQLLDAGLPVSVYSNTRDTTNKMFRASFSDYLTVIRNSIKYPIGRKLLYAAIKDKIQKNSINLASPNLELLEPVDLSLLAETNSKYAMALSFTSANSTGVLKKPVDIVNLRNFEIPMSGGVQFCRYTEEIASYFEPDKEIILYHNHEELIDKAIFYLRNDQASIRRKIKEAARKRAEKDHTWFNRFSIVFNTLELKI